MKILRSKPKRRCEPIEISRALKKTTFPLSTFTEGKREFSFDVLMA